MEYLSLVSANFQQSCRLQATFAVPFQQREFDGAFYQRGAEKLESALWSFAFPHVPPLVLSEIVLPMRWEQFPVVIPLHCTGKLQLVKPSDWSNLPQLTTSIPVLTTSSGPQTLAYGLQYIYLFTDARPVIVHTVHSKTLWSPTSLSNWRFIVSVLIGGFFCTSLHRNMYSTAGAPPTCMS